MKEQEVRLRIHKNKIIYNTIEGNIIGCNGNLALGRCPEIYKDDSN